jgi:4-hydroxy-tetrahydrodipicolinate reductase
MKIGLIGFGKMGKMVESVALQNGHQINSIIDPNLSNVICENSISDCEVLIDFSHPLAVVDNVKKSAECGKNIVVGTTGWQDHLEEIKKTVDKYQIGFFHSPNFSIGVCLFMKLIEKASSYLKDYEVAGAEIHHKEKLDAPSGTALALTEIIKQNRSHLSDDFSFSSTRVGSVPGTHSVIFDSPEDTITLTHQARNREGFAQGAVKAAVWLQGKKGIHTMDDLIGDLL